MTSVTHDMRRMGRGLLELRRWAPGFYSLPKERLMGAREGGREGLRTESQVEAESGPHTPFLSQGHCIQSH